jgi:hypothetical protein
MALVGMSAAARDLAEADRERLVDTVVSESAPIITEHTDAMGFAYDIGTNVTTAQG